MNTRASNRVRALPDPEERMVDVFLRYLRAEGARVVFGVPGGLLHPFFAGVEGSPDMQLIVTKHECGAAFMADGYARISGSLAVCAGTSGPGATNLFTGVAVAFSDSVPLLVITGQAPSHAMGKGAAQEMSPEDVDIVAMFKPITKYSAMVPSADRMPHHLRRALRQALTGRPGPVHLNIPVDFWSHPVREKWFAPATYRPKTELFDRAAVAIASKTLLEAENPCILIGSGVGTAGASEHVQSLAEMLPARVATTPRAKGLFPEDHPLSMGVMGMAGHATAKNTLFGDEVDVLITIGTSLGETTTLNWDPRLMPSSTFIQLDIEADTIGRNYPVDIPLVGDAQTITIELIYHLHRAVREGHRPVSKWMSHPPIEHGHEFYEEAIHRTSAETPITPQRWRVELNEVLPRNAILFSDIGGHMLFNIHHLCIKKSQKFVLNLGFGSMGHGTTGPVGAALAAPDRPVLAIIGDACFAMCGMELLTAREYDLGVIWIVENNQMHGITWHGSQKVGDGTPMNAVRNAKEVDIAAIARAMGLQAWRITQPGQLGTVVSAALALKGPAVIEVMVDGQLSPPLGDRAKTIAGFRHK